MCKGTAVWRREMQIEKKKIERGEKREGASVKLKNVYTIVQI